MTKVRIIGRREQLEEVLEELYSLRLVELVDAEDESELALDRPPGAAERAHRREVRRVLLAELDALLELAGARGEATVGKPGVEPEGVDVALVRAQVDELAPRAEELTGRIERLFAEEVVLRRHLFVLRHLLDSMPELRLLEGELTALRLATIVLVLDSEDQSIVELLRDELRSALGARFLLASVPLEAALGCVLVYPVDATPQMQEMLSRRRVRQLPLPEAYRDLSLSGSVGAMERRLGEIPGDVTAVDAELAAALVPHLDEWMRARDWLAATLEQIDAAGWAGATERTFLVSAWIPRSDLESLRDALERGLSGEIVVEELPWSHRDAGAPVLLRNPAPARPFELLVKLYDQPRARSLDPTGLVALFAPLMFGMMVGDVAYGALLLSGALLIRAKLGARSAVARDSARILAIAAVWAIVFGVVFGELLGDLGERWFGMPALWHHRNEAGVLEPLLLLAVAIGSAHVVLGYVLGLWQARRDRHAHDALAPAGSLLVLAGLFGIAGIAAARLPGEALGVAGAVAIVGLVIVSASGGPLGLLLGPLEVIGSIGNVLSYLRLAAVGLASVYLAVIANKLATVAPIYIGVVVAAFLHALNLLLAGFTPAVQALRLQYVEFFGKFFIGGGRPFRPFGADRRPMSSVHGALGRPRA